MQLWSPATSRVWMLCLEAIPSNSIKLLIFLRLVAWFCNDCGIKTVVLGIQSLTSFNNAVCADKFCLTCEWPLLSGATRTQCKKAMQSSSRPPCSRKLKVLPFKQGKTKKETWALWPRYRIQAGVKPELKTGSSQRLSVPGDRVTPGLQCWTWAGPGHPSYARDGFQSGLRLILSTFLNSVVHRLLQSSLWRGILSMTNIHHLFTPLIPKRWHLDPCPNARLHVTETLAFSEVVIQTVPQTHWVTPFNSVQQKWNSSP